MAKGRPAGLRLETAARTQIEFQQSSLDDLLAPDHRARQVWDYVEELDLSVLYGRVQTTVSSSGRPAIDPAILVSLWLYATLEGVGSARLLDDRANFGEVAAEEQTIGCLRFDLGQLAGVLGTLLAAGFIERLGNDFSAKLLERVHEALAEAL